MLEILEALATDINLQFTLCRPEARNHLTFVADARVRITRVAPRYGVRQVYMPEALMSRESELAHLSYLAYNPGRAFVFSNMRRYFIGHPWCYIHVIQYAN